MKLDNPIPKPLALKGHAMRLALALCLFAFPALAEEQCGPHDQVIKALGDKWGETRRGLGLLPNGRVLEIFANDDLGTWTIIATDPALVTCLIASGQAWESRSDPLPANG